MRLGIRTVPGRVLAPVIAALLLSGCGTSVGNGSPLPTWPVSPETLPPATDAVPDGFRLATWAPDPAFPSPGPGSTSMHILVWEALCASGRPTTGENTMSSLLIRGGTVVNADRAFRADVLCEGGKISAVGSALAARWRSGLPRPHGHACHSHPARTARSTNPARWRSDPGRSALTGVHRGVARYPALTDTRGG